jgi:YVTN family beta-propeller protein
MEENRYELLNEKNENVVQFNVVNTTPSPIFVNLFNTSQGLSTIPTSPTYINQPNSIVTTFGASGQAWNDLTINSNTNDIIACNTLNRIFFYSSSGVLITAVVYAGTSFKIVDYNPLNNQVYSVDGFSGDVFVTDCTSFAFTVKISTTIGGQVISSALNSATNTLFYVKGSSSTLYSINCNTNTQNTDIVASANLRSVSYNSTNNQLYLTTTTNTCIIYDLSTNTFLSDVITLPTLGESSRFNFTDNTLYIASQSTDDIYVIDCVSNTIIATINLAGIIPVLLAFDSVQNKIYATSSTTNIAVVDCSSNTFSTSITNANQSEGIAFNPNNNSVYFTSATTNDISQVTTTGVTTTPYYISGSVNYNLFLNNLNNEPVSIQMFRLFVNNQNQLFNQLQLTKIDSNGNQIFLPNFPINEVSAYQQQGNIGEIPVKDVIFDGRTYVNQYQINANENISFEIYYKQVDLTSASPSFPIFFKPKIQLKDYIKNN